MAWNEPEGFRNLVWGDSIETAKQKIPQSTYIPETTMDLRTCGQVFSTETLCSLDLVIGPVPVRTFLPFDRGPGAFERGPGVPERGFGLYRVSLSFGSSQYEALKTIFIERYGQPTDVQMETVQNQMGAKFQNERLAWIGERTNIVLSRYGTQVTLGSAIIESGKMRTERLKRFQDDLKRGKDQL